MIPYDKRLNPYGLVDRWADFISQAELDRMHECVRCTSENLESTSESDSESTQNRPSVFEQIPELSRFVSNTHSTPFVPVSYTHLTLPTIYSV